VIGAGLTKIWRFVPQAAVSNRSKSSPLFDHLVGAADQRQREGDAESLGGLDVDDQLDLHSLLNWQIGRLGTLQNPPDIDASQPWRCL